MASQLTFADARPRPSALRLTVLPDAARVDARRAQVARERGFAAGRSTCSLLELERALVSQARRAGLCPPAASPLALVLALREAARDHSSGPFAAIAGQPGYVRALGELLGSLAQGLLEPEELAGLDVPRAAALGRTLSAARRLLDRAGLCEPARALRLAIEALPRLQLPPLLERAAEVEFDGILDWTPLRLRLVQALSARLKTRLRLPWSPGRPELTAALEPALRALERGGEGPELVLENPAEKSPLAPFLDGLFGSGGSEAAVGLLSCASPSAQAREIAARCADLLAAGAAPERIGVAVRSLAGGGAEELLAAFERLGIPLRERRGRPALSAAPVRFALSLYDLCERDFPREPLIDLLSSRLVWLREEGEALPPQALARILRSAHVRDDATDGGYAARLQALEARQPAGVAETERRVQRVIAGLRGLPLRASVREQAAALLGLLERFGLQRRLRAGVDDEGGAVSRAALQALGRDQAALRALEDACAGPVQAAAQLGLSQRAFERWEFAQLLRTALEDASLAPGGAQGGAVQLLELREVWGRELDHLMVAGLADGELPARAPIDPLLTDEEKQKVNRAVRRAVFRLPAEPGETAPLRSEEPLLFHLALTVPRKSAALFWPRADAEGRLLLRSPFADEAVRALGREAERVPLAPIAFAPRSPGELLARAALEAFAEPAFRVSAPAEAAAARALAAAAGAAYPERMARIARAAEIERERLRAFVREAEPGRFSGRLSGAARSLAAEFFSFSAQSPGSAGQLEEHARCGFRSLGHRLLGIALPDEDDDELNARERGNLMHRCLERFFRRMRDEGRLPLRGAPEELQTLRDTALEEMAAFEAQTHVGHHALWELKKREALARLAGIAEAERGQAPLEFEQRFGFPEESWPPLKLDDAYLRGAIDRIDRAPGGLVVLDYKSSRTDSLKRRMRAAALFEPEFQLAVYAAVLRQERPEEPVDAVYLSLNGAERTPSLRRGRDGIDVDALLELDPARRAALRALDPKRPNLADAVQAEVRALREGHFEVRPLTCEYCELKPACRLVTLPTEPEENNFEVTRA